MTTLVQSLRAESETCALVAGSQIRDTALRECLGALGRKMEAAADRIDELEASQSTWRTAYDQMVAEKMSKQQSDLQATWDTISVQSLNNKQMAVALKRCRDFLATWQNTDGLLSMIDEALRLSVRLTEDEWTEAVRRCLAVIDESAAQRE